MQQTQNDSYLEFGSHPSPCPLSDIGQFCDPIFNAQQSNSGRQRNMDIGSWTRDARRRKFVHAALDSRLSQSLTSRRTMAELRSHVVGDCSARIKRMVTRGNVGFEEIRF